MYEYKYHCIEMRKQKNLPILSKAVLYWTAGQRLFCFPSVPVFGCNGEM